MKEFRLQELSNLTKVILLESGRAQVTASNIYERNHGTNDW